MSVRGVVAWTVVATAVFGCKAERREVAPAGSVAGESPGTGRDTGTGTAASGDLPVDPKVAALPGELWFVEDGPPRRLVRLAGGARVAIEGELFPSAARLADGRVIAIRSKGDGSVDAEQLIAITSDGTTKEIGSAASQVRDPVVVAGGEGEAIVAAIQIDGRSNLYRIEVADGAMTQLTSDPQGNFRPARLGGEAIVFVSSRDGDAELYRGSARGGKVVRLTAFHRDDFEPTPSPDGKTIAFLSDREGVAPRLFLVKADGTELRRLTRLPSDVDDEEGELVWSPDGARIAYVERRRGAARLIVHDVASGAQRVVTPAGRIDAEPVFSPDGAWIVVSRATRPARDDADLWAEPVEGGEAIQVTRGSGSERLPRWFSTLGGASGGDRPD